MRFFKSFFLMLMICLACVLPKFSIAAHAANFTLVYHYSMDNKSKQVVETHPALSAPIVKTAKELGFTSKTGTFTGWYAQNGKTNQWALYNANPSVIKFGAYQTKLYSVQAGKKLITRPAAGVTFHLYGVWAKKTKYDPSPESDSNQKTFKIVYHYSLDNQDKKVVKTYKVGTRPELLSATEVKFDMGSTFLGWNMYRERENTWLIDSGNLSVIKFASYRSKLYLLSAGKKIPLNPAAGDALHVFGVWAKKDKYTPDSEVTTSKTTYKIVYHYSLDNQTKKVVKTYKVGEKPILMNAKEVGFTSTDSAFLGWNGYREKANEWIIDSGNESIVKFGAYQSKLYLLLAGKQIVFNPKAGDAFHVFAKWEKKDSKYTPSPQGSTATNTYKIVYHYSMDNQSKTVTKTYSCGTNATLLSAKECGFTSDKNIMLGWNGYKEQFNEWVLYNKNPDIVKFGAYQSKLYLLLPGKKIVYNPKRGDVFHLFGAWMDAEKIDASHHYFATNVKGESQDYAQIQNALNVAKSVDRHITVYVPKKTYTITNTLMIFSDTTISLADGAVIQRATNFKQGDSDIAENQAPMITSKRDDLNTSDKYGAYKQGQNITVQGGTWRSNISTASPNEGSVMRFNHGNNITVKNCTIKDFNCKHPVAFAGCKNILVSGVTIKDFQSIKGTFMYTSGENVKGHGEAIHLDTCQESGEPDAFPLDGTICENIVIENCTFSNVMTGIGNHVYSKQKTEKLTVRNCTFKNIKYYCYDLWSKKNPVLKNNKVVNTNGKKPVAYICQYDSTMVSDHPELGIDDGWGTMEE